MTKDMTARADVALNHHIEPEYFDQAIARFNARAATEHQLMRLFANSKGELELSIFE